MSNYNKVLDFIKETINKNNSQKDKKVALHLAKTFPDGLKYMDISFLQDIDVIRELIVYSPLWLVNIDKKILSSDKVWSIIQKQYPQFLNIESLFELYKKIESKTITKDDVIKHMCIELSSTSSTSSSSNIGIKLLFVFPEFTRDKDIMLMAIQIFPAIYNVMSIDNPLFKDPDIIAYILKTKPGEATRLLYSEGNPHLRNDPEFALKLLKITNNNALIWNFNLQDNVEFAKNVIKEYGVSLTYFAYDIIDNKNIVSQALRRNGDEWKYITDNLKKDISLAKLAITHSPSKSIYQYMTESLKDDYNISLLAIKTNISNAKYTSTALKNNIKFILDVVTFYPEFYIYIEDDKLRYNITYILKYMSVNIKVYYVIRYVCSQLYSIYPTKNVNYNKYINTDSLHTSQQNITKKFNIEKLKALMDDRYIALYFIALCPDDYYFLNKKHWKDKEIAIEIIKKHHEFYNMLDGNLKEDKDIKKLIVC